MESFKFLSIHISADLSWSEAGKEGPAAATLPEGAHDGATKHSAAGDLQPFHHREPADLRCDSVAL